MQPRRLKAINVRALTKEKPSLPEALKSDHCIRLLLLLAGTVVTAQIVNAFISPGLLSGFGIIPRHVNGLIGIPLAPFIHHSWSHLFSNLLPLLILTWLVCQLGARFYWLGTLGIIFLGGICVWLFGSRGLHAGASGLIFGYWGLLIANALFCRRLKSLFIAFIVLILYGGLFVALLDIQTHVSWSSHLFGALAGVFMARLLTLSRKPRRFA